MVKKGQRLGYLAVVFAVQILLYKVSSLYGSSVIGYDISIPLDNLIPFSPIWVIVYVLYYPAIILPFFMIDDKPLFTQLSLAYLLVVALTVPFYFLFVVTIERPDIVTNCVFSRIVSFLYSIDNPVNLFPSQHVAFIWTSAFFIRRKFAALGLGYIAFAILVSMSTVLIKQHYLLDIPAGFLVAFCAYRLSLRYNILSNASLISTDSD